MFGVRCSKFVNSCLLYSDMLLISSLLLAIAGCSSASPFSRRQTPDNTQPVGTNPITNFSTQFLGVQVAGNSCSHRDLGFTGHIQGKWVLLSTSHISHH